MPNTPLGNPGEVIVREHVRVVVRHQGLLQLAGVDFLAADDDRNVDLLGRPRFQPRLQLGPLRRAGRVAVIGLVDRRRARRTPANAVVNVTPSFRDGAMALEGFSAGEVGA